MGKCPRRESKLGTLKRLQPLDLTKCSSVGTLVEGLGQCSFAARMLGQAAASMRDWFTAGQPPRAVFTYGRKSNIMAWARRMVDNGLFKGIHTTRGYADRGVPSGGRVVVIGPFEPWFQEVLDHKPEVSICINTMEMAASGGIQDGFFPGYVGVPAEVALPAICAYLDESLKLQHHWTMVDFLDLLEWTGGQAGVLAQGARLLEKMVRSKLGKRGEYALFLTLSGAMTPAQMSLVIEELISREFVSHVTSTGALMAHGLISGVGLSHYAYDPSISDEELQKAGLNRVTDSLEPETNFSHIEEVVDRVLWTFSPGAVVSTAEFHRRIGEHLASHYPDSRAILRAAYDRGIEVVVPAFVDSELGNDVACHNMRRENKGEDPIIVDPSIDSLRRLEIGQNHRRIGIFSVGGGVPRNNVQNDAPLADIVNQRLGRRYKRRRFSAGVRIDPAQKTWGSLGGCTYNENKSWGKFVPGASTAEIAMDATVALPVIVAYLLERQPGWKTR